MIVFLPYIAKFICPSGTIPEPSQIEAEIGEVYADFLKTQRRIDGIFASSDLEIGATILLPLIFESSH